MDHATILILDFGSQYTKLIARRIRELGYYSRILPGDSSLEKIKREKPRAVILSGGPASVYDSDAPQIAAGFFDWIEQGSFSVLGICYGMQLISQHYGGEVKPAQRREYGRMPVFLVAPDSMLFSGLKNVSWQAWMSHGDEVGSLPKTFRLAARSSSGAVAAMECPNLGIYGLQFHPEVTHTENGSEILKSFLKSVARLEADWNMNTVCDEAVAAIQKQVGKKEHVICALSGGVDSAVAAQLVHRAIGDRLHCVFVDHGLLRHDEQKRVMDLFEGTLKLPVTCVDASQEFLSALAGVTDPERKRKIIGGLFIKVFDRFAEEVSHLIGHLPPWLVQGTLYPDVIESSPAPSGAGGKKHSVTIKSHHNVGGLPEKMRFQLVEPLRDLFKDEVRELGKVLGVPEAFLKRHPFPGPGLAVRIIGEVTPERLEILRGVDEIFIQELYRAGLYDQIWQAFAVFLPIKSVGVQGDGRTHDHVVALRAVTSSDGMTADWFPFPPEFLARVSSKICNEVRGVNRVVYDVSSKPPATIEWE